MSDRRHGDRRRRQVPIAHADRRVGERRRTALYAFLWQRRVRAA